MKYNAEDYLLFQLADYVDNPVAFARINAGINQDELAKRMSVSQAYISKLEDQDKISAKVLMKVNVVIKEIKTE